MIKIDLIIPFILLISVALISGLLFSFTIAVSPGLKHMSAFEFLKIMKSINKEILNPLFLFCFFSPILFIPMTIFFYQGEVSHRWLLIAAFLIYAVVIFITAFINVPLNNQLERMEILNKSTEQLETFRVGFESRWTFWNTIRTILSITSLILLNVWQFGMRK